MTRFLPPAAVLMLLLSAARAADGHGERHGEQRIYKVDSVIATMKGHALVIEAKGAVQSGGWRGAQLRRMHSGDPATLAVEFVATPPPPDMVVIEGLVPISATLRLPARHAPTTVQVAADVNDVTSQVLH